MAKRISFDVALAALQTASTAAQDMAASVCIALVDEAGSLIAFIRQDSSFLISSELAIDKAWTATGMKMSTRGLGELLSGAPANVRDGLLRRPRLTEVPGGIPIVFEGSPIGGIGVSGGSAEEDEQLAEIALRTVMEKLT